MDLLGTLAILTLIWAVTAVATAAIVGAVWRPLESRIARLHPSNVSLVCTAAAVSPFVVPTLLVAMCLAPGTLGLLGLPADHCLRHPDHAHLCLVHGRIGLTPLLAAWLAGAGVGVALLGGRLVRHLVGARRELALLTLTRSASGGSRADLIASSRAFSITAGFVRPKIWYSTALVERLTPQQLAVVEAHERAHVRRRDPLVRLIAGWLSRPIRKGARRSILDRLHLASEQACDEAAGAAVGDRVLVAEALLCVARMADAGSAARGPVAAVSFGGGFVSARVASLLDPVEDGAPLRVRRWLIGIGLVGVLLVAPLHHAIEHALMVLGVSG